MWGGWNELCLISCYCPPLTLWLCLPGHPLSEPWCRVDAWKILSIDLWLFLLSACPFFDLFLALFELVNLFWSCCGVCCSFYFPYLFSLAKLHNDLRSRLANSGKAWLFQKHLHYHWSIFFCEAMYKSSTFVLAQGVFRKNFRLDLTDGLFLKQRMLIRLPNSLQP